MKTKQRVLLGIVSLAVVVLLFLIFRGRNGDDGRAPSGRPTLSGPVRERPGPSEIPSPAPTPPKPPDVVQRASALAVVASSEMVEQRSVEFTNLLGVIRPFNLGTILTVGSGEKKVAVPAGVEVQSLEEALSRCHISLLLWDESIRQSVIEQLEDYCQTGGWVLFVACPWTGGTPRSSPAGLLALRDFRGITELAKYVNDTVERRATALLKHPSLPDLPVQEGLSVRTPRKVLSGMRSSGVPLVRFENPAVRGITIRALGHGGIVDVNWDCMVPGAIGEIGSEDIIKTILAWLAAEETWREPVEQPGVPLKIIARTPTGDPAPGAEIAVKLHTDWAKAVSQEVVTVDDGGVAEIPAVAPAIYMAWASGEGYSSDTPALGRVEEEASPEPLVVTVRASLRIMGTAVYTGEATGPAAGVGVDLLPSSRALGIDVISARTDDEGRFGFEGVPGGRPYLLRCETEAWAALQEIDLPESAEGGTFEVTLSLEKLVAIDGRVLEEGNEQNLIEGATVRFEPRWGIKALPLFSHYMAGQSASTGSEGEFRLLVLPEVTYRLRAAAPGYVWREQKTDEIERTPEGWVEVTPPATVTLELGKGTTVKGIVYFPGGQPAPGTRVRVSSWPASIQSQNTDSEGRFYFPSVLLHPHDDKNKKLKSVGVSAFSGDYGGGEILWVPTEQEEVEVPVTMEPYSLTDVCGVVTDIEGQPVPGAMLNHSGDSKTDILAQTDQNGYFEVAMRPERELHVWKEGYKSTYAQWEEIEAAKKDRTMVRVVLPREDGWIAGKVVLHDGTPLRNEMVDFRTAGRQVHGYTLGDRGEFRLEGIPVEGTRLKAFKKPVKDVSLFVCWYPAPNSREIKVTAYKDDISVGATDVVVRFEPFGAVRGKVVDGENAAHVGGAYVFLSRQLLSWECKSSSSGEFQVDWLTPGTYELIVWSPGYWVHEGDIEVRRGYCDIGEVYLHKTITVQGEAVDEETGMAVEGVEVALETRGHSVRATTDSTGRFHMTIATPPGVRTLTDAAKQDLIMGIDYGGSYSWAGPVSISWSSPMGVIDLGAIRLHRR